MDNNKPNTVDSPKSGILLLSEPFLADENFERSVVLICAHNEEGTFGFVLNQPTEMTLNEVLEDESLPALPVYLGGPVEQNTLHFLHKVGEKVESAVQIDQEICWSGDFDQVKQLIKEGIIKSNEIKFFVGYSGWETGQLTKELKEKVWIMSKFESDFIFNADCQNMWKEGMKKLGGKYKLMANYPVDPRLN